VPELHVAEKSHDMQDRRHGGCSQVMSPIADYDVSGHEPGVSKMLVLTRKVGEQVVIPLCKLTVTILDTTPSRVRLGISAPANVVVNRSEVSKRIRSDLPMNTGAAIMSVRILIADQDEYLSTTYREYLLHHGAIVATATTGLACVARLRDFSPDVLVLDPSLPWGGGDGVLAMMNEEPQIRPACVLLLTEGGNRTLLYRLSSFRVDDYRTKPLSPEQLMERICTLRMQRSTSAGLECPTVSPATQPLAITR
jgi:carbon storage regulator CsrA